MPSFAFFSYPTSWKKGMSKFGYKIKNLRKKKRFFFKSFYKFTLSFKYLIFLMINDFWYYVVNPFTSPEEILISSLSKIEITFEFFVTFFWFHNFLNFGFFFKKFFFIRFFLFSFKGLLRQKLIFFFSSHLNLDDLEEYESFFLVWYVHYPVWFFSSPFSRVLSMKSAFLSVKPYFRTNPSDTFRFKPYSITTLVNTNRRLEGKSQFLYSLSKNVLDISSIDSEDGGNGWVIPYSSLMLNLFNATLFGLYYRLFLWKFKWIYSDYFLQTSVSRYPLIKQISHRRVSGYFVVYHEYVEGNFNHFLTNLYPEFVADKKKSLGLDSLFGCYVSRFFRESSHSFDYSFYSAFNFKRLPLIHIYTKFFPKNYYALSFLNKNLKFDHIWFKIYTFLNPHKTLPLYTFCLKTRKAYFRFFVKVMRFFPLLRRRFFREFNQSKGTYIINNKTYKYSRILTKKRFFFNRQYFKRRKKRKSVRLNIAWAPKSKYIKDYRVLYRLSFLKGGSHLYFKKRRLFVFFIRLYFLEFFKDWVNISNFFLS